MHRTGVPHLLARLGFLALLVLAVPLTGLAVLFAPPLEPWRRAKAESLLSDAIDLKTRVNGDVRIGFSLNPSIVVTDIAGEPDDMPETLDAVSAKSISLRIALIPLLAGRIELSALVIDGLVVGIEIPVIAKDADADLDVAGFVQDFVRSPFAGDIVVHDAQLNYVNKDTGFTILYAFDSLSSITAKDGRIAVAGAGRINDEPWKLDGKVEPPGEDAGQRRFTLAASQAGLTTTFGGSYRFGDPADSIDAVFTGEAPALSEFLDVYAVKSDFEGSGTFSARFTGPLATAKMSELELKLAFDNGIGLRMTGGAANAIEGTGLDLAVTGTLPPTVHKEGEAQPIYDIGIKGFSGRIAGDIDDVLVRDLHVETNSIKAAFRDIGPITAERLWKDPDGRLGLYDILVLTGDPKRPSLKITGTIKDVLQFQGVALKGNVDFQTTDFLDLAAEDKAAELGRLEGSVAVSDADGSLGIEQFSVKTTGTSLVALSIELVFDDITHGNELTFATHLDVPSFRAFSAALGSNVEELGRVKFDGQVVGSDEKLAATGTTLVGETTITGTVSGSLMQGRPELAGDIATSLLHLSDVLKLSSIKSVYQANVDDKDVDVFDYSRVWQTLFVDMQIKVARIAGGGNTTSNIQGRVTYLAGVVGLDPVTMTFLGGKASASGKVDTNGATNSFALNGRVDNMRIGAVLRELKVDYPVSGALQVRYDLTGAGNAMAQVPRSLDGTLSVSLRNGWLGTSLLDLAGLSLPNWLLTRTPGGNQANLVCMVAPFSFERGKGTTRGFVMETDDVQVVGVGFIDFRDSYVNLQFKPRALRQQFIKIAQPFAVKGPLNRPQLRLTGAPVAGAVVEVLAFPFNLLDTIIQPGPGERGRAPCRIIQAQTARGPLSNLPLIGRNGPLPPLLGPASPLGILTKPLFGGAAR